MSEGVLLQQNSGTIWQFFVRKTVLRSKIHPGYQNQDEPGGTQVGTAK